MKALQEPTVYYHDLQTSSGGSSMCNHAEQEKGTFQQLEIYKHDYAQQWLKERFSNLTVLNSHKEGTAKNAPLPPHLNVGGHRPLHLKNCSPGPVGGFNS